MMLSRILTCVGAFFNRLNRLLDMLVIPLLFPLRGKALFSIRLSRRPGARCLEKFDDLAFNWVLGMGVVIGLAVGCFLGYYVVALLPTGLIFWGSISLAVVLGAGFASRRHFDRMRNFKIGFLAEIKAAEFLERLGRTKWRVIHGFEIRDGDKCRDIDHIVVCPHGVFCVETKAIRKFKDEECNGALEYTPPNSQAPQEFGAIVCFNGHQDESKQVRRPWGRVIRRAAKNKTSAKIP